MAKQEYSRDKRDPAVALLYGVAAVLLLAYCAVSILGAVGEMTHRLPPVSPLLRLTMLVLVCLAAYLGARLPRRGAVEGCLNAEDAARLCLARRTRVRRALWLCFGLYLHLILTFTLFDSAMGRDFLTILDATAEDRAYYMEWFVNLRPFETIRTIYIDGFRNGYITLRYLLLNLAGNVCAFMPFAFFLPVLWRRIDRVWKFLPLMLAIVVSVELCQLALMCGSCDIDDVFLNVGGATAAYAVLRVPVVRRMVEWVLGENK